MADDKTADVSWEELRPQLIKMALELGPLVVFFIVNARADIFVGTAWFMGAMVLALALSWLLLKRIAVMPLVTAVVVLVFGGLTLYFHDDTFIKMKPTIVDALFGAVLLGGLVFHQSLLRYVFGEVYKLKPEGWTVLTLRWGVFFFFLAALNEVVWRTQSTDVWIAFKVWATMPVTIIFAALQLPVLTKYAPDHKVHEIVPPLDPLP
ncbi:MAG TPA: septation protein A [Devosia sp.]|jgi:intracellular septation protein|nr:septation protein A [Devosia sp.]